MWIRIFPDKPVTKKPAEVRMGSGKGPVDRWVAVVKPGRMMFEIAGVDMETAKEAMRLASHKLPCQTRVVERMTRGRLMAKQANELFDELTAMDAARLVQRAGRHLPPAVHAAPAGRHPAAAERERDRQDAAQDCADQDAATPA